MMHNLKKTALALTLSMLVVFLLQTDVSKGQFGERVPVEDAEVIDLLEQLVEKELEDDPDQRERAQENLDLATDYILSLLQRMGRKGDINDQGQVNVFVDNWRNFTLEGQYRGEDIWRGLLYLAANGEENTPPILCQHIRESQVFNSLQPTEVENLRQNLGAYRKVDSLQEYLLATQCDPAVDQNFDTFMDDFAAGGGWAMLDLLSKPQNNIFGAIGLATEELEKQRGIEEQSDIQEANSGSGYLGRRQCLSTGSSGQCVVWSDVNIPANLAVEILGALLNQNLAFIANTDEAGEGFGIEINNIIEAIFGEQ